MPMTSPRRAPGRRTGKNGASPARTGGAFAIGAEHGLSNQLLQRRPLGRVRASEEGEADRMADHALRGESPLALPRTAAPREGASLFRSRGRPLDREARARFAPHFPGLDEVRIHDDGEGARAATALGARAFTAGRDIAFGPGRYAPGTGEGARLLAHELAHVAQGGDTIRRAPLEGQDEFPPITSLFTLDYWGDQVCGGRPCFTDEMVEQWIDESQQRMIEEAAASVPPPIGEIGEFDVSIGAFSDDPAVSPAAPAVAASARVPTVPIPPLGENRIVAGGKDFTSVAGAVSMSIETEQPIVRLRGTTLAGAQEISLVAHGNSDVVRIGDVRLPPDALAEKLIEAGWRGKVVRLVACETGVVGGPPAYAQRLANALATRGVESAVIAPIGDAVFADSVSPLPRVLPPGATPIPENLRNAGGGWRYAVPDVPLGAAPGEVPRSLPLFHPGTWSGAGLTGAQMAVMFALSYLHAQAVAERVQKQTAETGFAGWGPTGDTLYDVGAWLLDPGNDANRSIPFESRFDMPTWRRNIARKCFAHPVGEELRMAWWTSDDPDPFGNPSYRAFYGIYKKLPDGRWTTLGCDDCEGKDFPPDLEKIISPFVSDDELWNYLELPRGDSMYA